MKALPRWNMCCGVKISNYNGTRGSSVNMPQYGLGKPQTYAPGLLSRKFNIRLGHYLALAPRTCGLSVFQPGVPIPS